MPPGSVGGVETLPPSLASSRRHGRPGQDAVDAAGIVPGRQVLEGVLAEVERIDPDRRVEIGVGRVAVGRGQVGPVIEGRGNQGVGTGHDRRGHRRPDLGEREGVRHGRAAVPVVVVLLVVARGSGAGRSGR